MLVIPGSSLQPSHLKSKYLPLIYLMFKTFECSRDPLLRKLFGNRCSYIQFFVIFPPTSQWTVRVKESSPLMISAPSILVVTKSRFRFAAYNIKLVARIFLKGNAYTELSQGIQLHGNWEKNKLVSLVRIMQGTKGAWLAKKKKNN